MKITVETDSYNERRYGKPWVAKVDFSNAKGDFSFGDWTGDHCTGGEGILSLDTNPGDIVATGQKDNRKPRNSAPIFFVVLHDGSLENIGNKGEAYKFYLENKESAPDKDALLIEKESLVARLAEIEKLIKKA